MKQSLKTRLLTAILLLIFASNVLLGGIAIFVAERSMSPIVQSSIEHVARSVAVQFDETNSREFRMLNTIAVLDIIRDTTVPLTEKINLVSSAVTAMDKNYVMVSVFDSNGKSFDRFGNPVDYSATPAYKSAMLGKKSIADPSFQDDGKLVLMYTIPIFDKDYQPCGGVYAIVKSERMYEVCGSLKIGKNSHPVVINMATGVIVGHSDLEKIRSRSSLKNEASKEFKNIVSQMCIGKSSWASYHDRGGKYVCAFRPVGPSCNWAVLCSAPYDDFFGTLKLLIAAIIVMIILTDIAAAFLSIALIKRSLRPLINVRKSINEIATGNADLTKRIKIESTDEIGDVVKGFNGFSEKLQSIISGVKDSKNLLSDAGVSLVASIQNTSNSINEILLHIREVHAEIESQVSGVGTTSNSVDQISQKITKLKDMIENQSQSVMEASSSVEEMIGNIASVNNSMDKMAGSFMELISSAEDGNKLQKDVNERISQIEEQSQMLQTANQVIASIASQTNLLAMNAAIEAAHAGEAGSGFSVVADEIRKLSENSTAQSKQIGLQIKSIRSSIDGMVTASNQSTKAFESVTERIQETDELVRQIKAALEEQNEGSRQISEALSSMNDTSVYVREASADMMESNKEILVEIENLKGGSETMARKMDEMKSGAKRIRETGSALSDISEKMEDSISEIGIQIDQFKV